MNNNCIIWGAMKVFYELSTQDFFTPKSTGTAGSSLSAFKQSALHRGSPWPMIV